MIGVLHTCTTGLPTTYYVRLSSMIASIMLLKL